MSGVRTTVLAGCLVATGWLVAASPANGGVAPRAAVADASDDHAGPGIAVPEAAPPGALGRFRIPHVRPARPGPVRMPALQPSGPGPVPMPLVLAPGEPAAPPLVLPPRSADRTTR